MIGANKINIMYIYPYSAKQSGAEEQDIVSGLKNLIENPSLEVYSVAVDFSNNNLLYDFSFLTSISRVKASILFQFWRHKITSPDFTLRQAFTLKNFNIITLMCRELKIDVIFTNTTSTFLFGKQKNFRHIHRSVSFEPVYVLKTIVNPLKKMIFFLLKIFTVLKEIQSDLIFTISPRDNRYYNLTSRVALRKSNTHILPLRHFSYLKRFSSNRFENKNMNIAFLGSTYNVLHNERSLNYLLNVLDSDFLNSNGINFNIYCRKTPDTLISKYSSNRVVFHNWVEDIMEVYELNQVFLVPNFLNSGMQSKVFEPLIAGRILICDPKVLSGYEFKPFQHYIPARDSLEFKKNLLWLGENQRKSMIISQNARLRSLELIGPKVIHDSIKKFVCDKSW